MVRVTLGQSKDTLSYQIIAYIEKELDTRDEASVIKEAIKDMAKEYAEQWLVDNLDKVYKNLNVEAISNLVMVEVAKQVKDNIVKEEK